MPLGASCKNDYVNPLLNRYSFRCIINRQILKKKMGKEKNARNEQFLLFPQFFPLNQVIVSRFIHIFDIVSLFAAELDEPKTGLLGKGLIEFNPLQMIKCALSKLKALILRTTH